MSDQDQPLPSPPVQDQSADNPSNPLPVQDQSADQPKTNLTPSNESPIDDPRQEVSDPDGALPDSGTQTLKPVSPAEEHEDVFGGEQDEAARLEIEKNLVTDTDNSPTPDDGEQPGEAADDSTSDS